MAEQGKEPDRDQMPEKRKPGPAKGSKSPNPSGKKKPPPPPEPPDPEGGEVTAARMRKVLGQDPQDDRGPTEKAIRAWLAKGVGAFVSKMRELEEEDRRIAGEAKEFARVKKRLAEVEAELAELKAARGPAAKDEGTARAKALIHRILAEAKR